MPVPLVQFLTDAGFRVTKFREGYDMIEVDDFIDEMVGAARALNPNQLDTMPDLVLNKKFQVTKFREGYDMVEVDDFLDVALAHFRELAIRADTEEFAANSAPVPDGKAQGKRYVEKNGRIRLSKNPDISAPRTTSGTPTFPFDGVFFNAIQFEKTRFGGLNIDEVDQYVAHVKRVVWRNDADSIYALSAEAINQDFSNAGLLKVGYSSAGVYEFLDDVNARAATY